MACYAAITTLDAVNSTGIVLPPDTTSCVWDRRQIINKMALHQQENVRGARPCLIAHGARDIDSKAGVLVPVNCVDEAPALNPLRQTLVFEIPMGPVAPCQKPL